MLELIKSRLSISMMLLIWGITAQASSNTATFLIDTKPIDQNQACILITASFTPDKNNELILNFPQHALLEMSLSSSSFTGEDLGPFTRKFNFSTNEPVTFKYKYCEKNPLKHIDYPSLQPDYFYITANQVLILPYSIDDNEYHFNIQFINIPKKWYKYTSTGQLVGEQIETIQHMGDFASWVFIATNSQPPVIKTKQQTLYIFKPNETKFGNENFINKLCKIINYQNKLMGYDSNSSLIVHIAQTEPGHYILGRHPKNTISLWIPEDRSEEEAILTLAHEHFHSWIGWQIRITQDRHEMTWFEEGINDYLAVLSTYRSGVLNEEQIVHYINELIKKFETSPFLSVKKDNLEAIVTSNMEAKMLAGIRGHLAALSFFDYSAMEGKENSVIKAVQNITKDDRDLPENQKILEHLQENFGNQYTQILIAMHTMTTLPASMNIFDGQYVLEPKIINLPNFGFNQKSFYESGIIDEIDPQSPAYKSGLRNGMKVVGTKINKRYPSPWYINVADEKNNIVQYEFTPEFKEQAISQFTKNPRSPNLRAKG